MKTQQGEKERDSIISRRDFIKGIAALIGGLAGTRLISPIIEAQAASLLNFCRRICIQSCPIK